MFLPTAIQLTICCPVRGVLYRHGAGSFCARDYRRRIEMRCDIAIVGAGPAGIFTALELVRNKSGKKHCYDREGTTHPETELSQGGCREMRRLQAVLPYYDGVFRRGRLFGREAFAESGRGRRTAGTARRTDGAGADRLQTPSTSNSARTGMWKGVGNDEKVKDIRKRAIQAGLRLVDCPIRHLGTEKAQRDLPRHSKLPAG